MIKDYDGVLAVGDVEEGALEQARNCLVDAEAFALMGDNHQGYGMPIGGVAVYKDKVSPAGVGFDISCGNKAVKLDIEFDEIIDVLDLLADEIFHSLSFGVGKNNEAIVDHPLFNSSIWDDNDFLSSDNGIKQVARNQLGTIGSGNHYVDVFYDEDEFVWVGVHFGSRGLGHKIASHYMKEAGDNLNIMSAAPSLIDTKSYLGQEYLAAMSLAGMYANAGRDWVCDIVANIIGAPILESVHNHHNFAWNEYHVVNEEPGSYWVVRKGATPAFPGQRGFIGGSMMDDAVIVEGVDSYESSRLFYSTVHGAGRVMSRSKAAGKRRYKKAYRCTNVNCLHDHFNTAGNEYKEAPKCELCGSDTKKRRVSVQVQAGAVDFEQVKLDMEERGIILRGAGPDESPQVYKRLNQVLENHSGTIDIVHHLSPVIVCMAGEGV